MTTTTTAIALMMTLCLLMVIMLALPDDTDDDDDPTRLPVCPDPSAANIVIGQLVFMIALMFYAFKSLSDLLTL